MQLVHHGPLPRPASASPRCSRNLVAHAQPHARHGISASKTIAEPLVGTSLNDMQGLGAPVELGWKDATELHQRYATRALVGVGSFGQVFSATCRHSGQEVAVKTMRKVRAKTSRDRTLQKVRREVAFLERLQVSPATVRLLDQFEGEHEVHLVTELCKGGDLRNVVECCGPLCEPSLASVARQALCFLRDCHDHGLLYGDLKPANLCLLYGTGGFGSLRDPSSLYVKAVDFGTSQNCGPGHRLSKWTGTLTFLAPEVFEKNYGHKADVWSLGVSLYWMFSRRYPFWSTGIAPHHASLDEMAGVVRNAPIAFDRGPFKHMSQQGLDLLQRCLCRDEAQRISVDDALQHPFLALGSQ